MSKESNKKVKIRTIMLRILAGILALLVIVIVSLLVYLNIKKNDISRDLLNAVNKELQGDFTVRNISLGSLYSYPNLSVSFSGLKFHAADSLLTHGELILEVENVKIKADLSDVFLKQLQIQNVNIKGATLYIERDSTGQMVISEGFRPYQNEINQADSTNLSLDINHIKIEDSKVVVLDRPSDLSYPIDLEKVIGTFKLEHSLISGNANIDILPLHIAQIESFILNELPMTLGTTYSVDIENELVKVEAKDFFIGDEHYSMNYRYDFTDNSLMEFQMTSLDEGVDLSELFVEQSDTLEKNDRIELQGRGQFKTDLRWRPQDEKPFLEALEANFALEGKGLKIYGIDLDGVIEKFKRSQEFNIADAGAVMFAGPAGLAVTKGTDFARLAFTKAGDSTEVNHFLADWSLRQGILTAEDVALSTQQNLVSTSGWFNVVQDSLDFTITILDKRGCELVGQRIYGKSVEPSYGKVKLLKTFLGPVKNFFRDIGIAKCDTVYFGKVLHPKRKNKE